MPWLNPTLPRHSRSRSGHLMVRKAEPPGTHQHWSGFEISRPNNVWLSIESTSGPSCESRKLRPLRPSRSGRAGQPTTIGMRTISIQDRGPAPSVTAKGGPLKVRLRTMVNRNNHDNTGRGGRQNRRSEPLPPPPPIQTLLAASPQWSEACQSSGHSPTEWTHYRPATDSFDWEAQHRRLDEIDRQQAAPRAERQALADRHAAIVRFAPAQFREAIGVHECLCCGTCDRCGGCGRCCRD
jgi:hypothetical protein